jgi:hypothetical protein
MQKVSGPQVVTPGEPLERPPPAVHASQLIAIPSAIGNG